MSRCRGQVRDFSRPGEEKKEVWDMIGHHMVEISHSTRSINIEDSSRQASISSRSSASPLHPVGCSFLGRVLSSTTQKLSSRPEMTLVWRDSVKGLSGPSLGNISSFNHFPPSLVLDFRGARSCDLAAEQNLAFALKKPSLPLQAPVQGSGHHVSLKLGCRASVGRSRHAVGRGCSNGLPNEVAVNPADIEADCLTLEPKSVRRPDKIPGCLSPQESQRGKDSAPWATVWDTVLYVGAQKETHFPVMEVGSGGISGGGVPAPYGRACTNCVRAKCRCILRIDGADCERCHRLSKECIPSVTVRKRNGRRSHVSRAAALEDKLEDIVTLLRNQNTTMSSAGSGAPARDTTRRRSSQEMSIELRPSTPSSSGHPVATQVDAPSPSSVTALPPARTKCKSDLYASLPTLYAHAPTMTVHHLQHHYPFLWFNVMTATCLNVVQQRGMATAATKFLAQKVVVESEKSLDPLLGVLTSITWAYNSDPEKKRLPVMYMLAKSLAYDLRLNRATFEQVEPCYAISNMTVRGSSQQVCARSSEVKEADLDSRCSMPSNLKRREALHWNAYMDESLKPLCTRPEWDGDIILASQVKVQLLVQELARALEQSGNRPSTGLLGSLRKRLHGIRADLPRHLQGHEAIICYIHHTDLVIQETALTHLKPPPPSTPDYERYEILQSCLASVTAWFETYCRMPPESYLAVPVTFWSQLSLCSNTLYRLTLLDDPAWDRQAVRERLDFLTLCDRLVDRYEKATERRRVKLDVSVEEDQFTRAARVLRQMRASAGEGIRALDSGGNTLTPTPVPAVDPSLAVVGCSSTVGMIPADDPPPAGVYGSVQEPLGSAFFQPPHHPQEGSQIGDFNAQGAECGRTKIRGVRVGGSGISWIARLRSDFLFKFVEGITVNELECENSFPPGTPSEGHVVLQKEQPPTDASTSQNCNVEHVEHVENAPALSKHGTAFDRQCKLRHGPTPRAQEAEDRGHDAGTSVDDEFNDDVRHYFRKTTDGVWWARVPGSQLPEFVGTLEAAPPAAETPRRASPCGVYVFPDLPRTPQAESRVRRSTMVSNNSDDTSDRGRGACSSGQSLRKSLLWCLLRDSPSA
ncbi:hypothetical protein V8F20_011229 [Naviculisporaceae sp. PSN 640]